MKQLCKVSSLVLVVFLPFLLSRACGPLVALPLFASASLITKGGNSLPRVHREVPLGKELCSMRLANAAPVVPLVVALESCAPKPSSPILRDAPRRTAFAAPIGAPSSRLFSSPGFGRPAWSMLTSRCMRGNTDLTHTGCGVPGNQRGYFHWGESSGLCGGGGAVNVKSHMYPRGCSLFASGPRISRIPLSTKQLKR